MRAMFLLASVGLAATQRRLVFCVFAASCEADTAGGFAAFIRLALQAWRIIVRLGLSHLALLFDQNGLGFC